MDTRIGGEVRYKMVLSLLLGNTNGRADCIGVGDVFSFGHVGSEEPRIHPSVGAQ